MTHTFLFQFIREARLLGMKESDLDKPKAKEMKVEGKKKETASGDAAKQKKDAEAEAKAIEAALKAMREAEKKGEKGGQTAQGNEEVDGKKTGGKKVEAVTSALEPPTKSSEEEKVAKENQNLQKDIDARDKLDADERKKTDTAREKTDTKAKEELKKRAEVDASKKAKDSDTRLVMSKEEVNDIKDTATKAEKEDTVALDDWAKNAGLDERAAGERSNKSDVA